MNLAAGVHVFPPSVLGKVSTFFNVAAGAAALAVNAAGECPDGIRWFYMTTLGVLIASTAQYVYLASERSPRRR